MNDPELKKKQEAGADVERKMIEFLIQFIPAGELKISDVLQIARAARALSFNAFADIQTED